jgi:hypothetical protein
MNKSQSPGEHDLLWHSYKCDNPDREDLKK